MRTVLVVMALVSFLPGCIQSECPALTVRIDPAWIEDGQLIVPVIARTADDPVDHRVEIRVEGHANREIPWNSTGVGITDSQGRAVIVIDNAAAGDLTMQVDEVTTTVCHYTGARHAAAQPEDHAAHWIVQRFVDAEHTAPADAQETACRVWVADVVGRDAGTELHVLFTVDAIHEPAGLRDVQISAALERPDGSRSTIEARTDADGVARSVVTTHAPGDHTIEVTDLRWNVGTDDEPAECGYDPSMDAVTVWTGHAG